MSGPATFYAQLGSVVRAGLPLREAVRLAGEAAGGPWRAQAATWSAACAGGQPLAAQLEAAGVERLASALVRAGEVSGRLPELCAELAAYYEHRRALRNLIIARLVYPTLLLHVALAAMGVPGLIRTWSPLPLLYGPAALWLLIAMLVMIHLLLRRSGGLARLALHWPLRPLAVPLVAGNTCLVLHAAQAAGMLHPDGLELAAGACGNHLMETRLRAAAVDLRSGRLPDLPTALRACGLPDLVLRLVETGEASGTTEQELMRAARLQREAFQERTLWAARIATGTLYAITMVIAAVVVISLYAGYLNHVIAMTGDEG